MSLTLSIVTAIHLVALSQIESGDNPRAIGKNGERTQYQISRTTAKHEFKIPLLQLCKLPKAELDLRVKAVWQERVGHFIKTNKIQPTPQQIYLLWNCPADVLKPSQVESERAQRFANLVKKFTQQKALDRV